MIVVIGCRLPRARESEYVMRDFKTVVLLWEREGKGESERERCDNSVCPVHI